MKSFTKIMAALALLVFMAPSMVMWGQVVSGTTYSTPSVGNLPTGWSGEDGGGTSYIKLIDANHYIQTAGFEQNGFTSITIKARKFGGPSETQAQISVSWYDSENAETVLGTIDPANTTLTNYTINTPAAGSGNGYVKIQCKGASASKGSGVSEVTITYTEPGGTAPTTYTITYYANVTGTTPIVDTYAEGADVTLRAANTFTNEGYTFSEWNTQADGDGDSYAEGDIIEDIDDDWDFYAIWTENTPSDDQWVLTNLADLTANDVFVIVGNNGSNYAMSNNNGTSNPPAAVAVTVTGDEITSEVAATIQWTISGDATDGYTFYPNGSTTTWLYCYNNNNGLRVGTSSDKTFVMRSNYLYNVGQERYIGIYQSSNWRSYTSINNNISGQTFAFYKKVTGGVVPPSITADNVNVEYNTTSGSIAYTINNGVEGGVLTATTESNWLTPGTVGTESVAFTCEENEGTERTATVTLTYTYNRVTVTKDVTVTQGANPNVPGTENNPYTVAQARAAIDANTGITGVYATGIVSAIPTAWNSQYSNITFNFVDNVGDTDFLQAYRCVSGTGVDASEVAVGDIVVVYGNLTKYGSTYEFGQGCQLVSLTHPAVEVEAPVFGLAEGGYADTQTVTLTCATEGSTIYYTTDGTTPDNNSTIYSDGITVSQTTTIKAIAYNNGSNSTVSAATYYILSNDNTLTVTDALGFDSYPVNNIFVQGIVSTAPTQAPTNNGELTYYISVDGAANDQLEVYKGKDLNNTAFDAQDDIQLGDIVTIFGNVKIYSSQKEFDQGNYLVAFERPEIPVIPSVTVTPATINAPAEGVDGTLAIAYENIEELISFDIQFCDANGGELEGDDPDWIYAEINEEDGAYSVSYIIDANDGEARTAYFKVYTFDDNSEEVYAIVTVNQAEYVAPALDYATLPFEFDGGRNDIESTDGLTQEGLDSDYGSSPKLKFNTTGDWLLLHFNERPGTLTFDIKGNSFSDGTFTVQTSEDGETFTNLENYTELTGTTVYSEEFNNLGENVRYIKWIYTNKATGNVALGNITLTEYVEPVLVASITVNPDLVEVNADEHDGTLDLTYENLTITEMGDFAIQYYDAVGEETEEPDWIEVLVAEQDPAEGEGYVVSYYMMKNEGEARTAYFKVYAMDDETNLVYSNLVTVNQAAYVAPVAGSKYVKVTSTDDLTDGQYLIVYEEVGLAFDGSLETLDAVSNTIDVTIAEGEIAVTEETTASEFTIAALSEGYSIQSASGYYIGQTSNANGLASSTENAYMNTISFTDGNADIVSSSAYLRYNSASNQARFRYFKSASYTNQQAIQLYKKVETPVTETYELIINGYTDDNVKNGYYLIASPVTVDPATVEGMTTGDFDLYEYDDTQDKEWLNWKGDQELNYEGHFNLVPGMGYLYAKKATDDNLTYNFILTGSPYDGTGTFDLVEGWNLLGNPFGETAYLDDSRDFYRMNSDGSDLIVNTDPNGGGNAIRIMEGIFVNAEVNDQVVTFTTENPGNGGKKIALNVSRNRGDVIDRAIVRFDEGSLLPKFQLNPDNTKIYITEGNQDYAVVRSAYESEMPVSFKASENGTYTFSANAANVEMTYLHLIDNLTGADIDLLATPSYTFDARTTDYASRFKLVFVANNGVNEHNGNNFAFFNGSEWVINNEGEATLEVIDMTGRILSTMTVNGNATTKVNAATGVYMLRLTNGNDVKTQKVVVK